MTEVAAVDIDGLLAEIFLTPEGRANPYPRYAAIREHARGFRSNLGFVVVARYDDCRWVLRDPRFGKGEPGPVWEGYCLTHEQWRERFVDLAHDVDARTRPTSPESLRCGYLSAACVPSISGAR